MRLLLDCLGRLRQMDKRWNTVRPGLFTMHIVSLHCFVNDYAKMKAVCESTKQNFKDSE
jgi:hypothetical protein